MENPKSNEIKIYPGLAIFSELGLLLITSSFYIRIFADYARYRQDPTLVPSIWGFSIFLAVVLGAFHRYFFAITDFNRDTGLSVYSHFTHKAYGWSDIESLQFIVSKAANYVSVIHGVGGFLCLAPSSFHTRAVRITVTPREGRERSFWLKINLGKVNRLFALLRDTGRFGIERQEINFTEYMGKKYKNPIRDLWLFRVGPSGPSISSQELFIRHEDGSLWEGKYSAPAKWLMRLGVAQFIAVFAFMVVYAVHAPFTSSNYFLGAFVAVIIVPLVVEFVLYAITPERKGNTSDRNTF